MCAVVLASGLCGAGVGAAEIPGPTPPETSGPRASQVAFKGMELYAWLADGDWRFALLPGTNRLKHLDDIRHPWGGPMSSIAAVKERLATLAPGESVVLALVDARDRLPDAVTDDLIAYGRSIQVTVGPLWRVGHPPSPTTMPNPLPASVPPTGPVPVHADGVSPR